MNDRSQQLLHIFPTFAAGGAQMRFCAVANHFGTRFRHAIVAIDGVTTCRERLNPGLLVDYLGIAEHKGDMIGNVLRYRSVLRDLAPDVLVTHNWGSMEWAIANQIVERPHVHIEDGFGPEERDRQLPRRVWTRRLMLRAATTVLPSRVLERIARSVWRLPKKRLRYIPNGIDLTRFTVRPPGDPAAPLVIGTVAGLRPEKNISRLLRAFALLLQHASARLVIVGSGNELPALQALASSLGIARHVRFAGHMPATEAAYREFDIFALPSDTEQMPISLLEAMASGLPVAATNVGDVAEMLAEPNRRFVVPRDDAALAAALRELSADARLRAALGTANRIRTEAEYGQDRMFRAYAELLLPRAAA